MIGVTMVEFQPSPEQELILAHNPRRHARVLAGPGAGKSSTLVELVDRLLRRENAPNIRLLTFTRAATGELAHRVAGSVTAAERPSTIHSFAISALLRNPGAGGFPEPLRIADDWEFKHIVKRTLAKRARLSVTRVDTLFRELAANCESLRPEYDETIDVGERTRFVGAWNEHREVYGYTLLSELPYSLMKALRDHPDVDGVDYEMLIVDEYQDLNACDLEVIKLISDRGCSVIGAGDDDQSIYSFRKAAPEGIRRFLSDFPDSADYSLSVTQRCGTAIVDWANHVIEGDPDRGQDRPRLRAAVGSPSGETALLSFANAAQEARGIAALVHRLATEERVPPSEILVLLRADHNGAFSKSIKEQLDRLHIPVSDPEAIVRMLEDADNRKAIATLRLLVHRNDSLAWATLLKTAPGVGDKFFNYVYTEAQTSRSQFGAALLAGCEIVFPGGPPSSSQRAENLIKTVLAWLDRHLLPTDQPETGWGKWIIDTTGDEVVPQVTNELADLLRSIDALTESSEEFGRYLGQINPLGKDLMLAKSDGVRIMTMGGAKGLTVQAAIIGALENSIIPRPDCDLAEERRLLYVAISRAREYVYGTWARRRQGPTARAGSPSVGSLRQCSHFLDYGPVRSCDGRQFIQRRWAR